MAKLKDGFYKLTAEAVGSDSYMLLAGGGSKALSDFATASGVVTALGTNGNYVTWTKNGTVNNLTVPYSTNADTVDNKHASDFIQTSGQMISGKRGALTGYHQENGWHRIATIDASNSSGFGSHILYLTGLWNYKQNTTAIIHINTSHTTGKITQISGHVGFADKIRLVNVSSNKFYVDIHINYTDNASSSSDIPGNVYYYFLGNGSVTINALVEKITDTVTAASEVTLVNTEGNVLTSDNYTNWINTTNFPGLNKVGTVTSVTVTGANGLSGSGTVTSSGTITLSNSGVRSTTINGNYLRVNTNGTNNDLTIPYATNADTLDNLHASDFVKITPKLFSLYKKGIWTKILTFTITNNSIDPSISFSWHPTECSRYVWADFNINIRLGAIIFMGNWKGSSIRTLKCVGDGTTYDVWVSGTKDSYDPYGAIQITSTYKINSYNTGSLAYQDTEPTGTYNANVSNTTIANYANSAGSVAWANVSGKPSFATVATSGSYNDLINKPTIPTSLPANGGTASKSEYLLCNALTSTAAFGLPYYSYTTLNEEFGTTGTDTTVYLQNYIKKLVKTHNSLSSKVGIGTVVPNSLHLALFRAYSLSDYNSTGLPLHCTGFSVDVGGSAYVWGTKNGTWFRYNLISDKNINNYYWANIRLSTSSNDETTPTFSTATTKTKLTTPLVSSTGRLTLNATSTSVDLKFNNDNTKSVILNGSAFKPFDDANNKLTLGSSSARWSELYSVKGNFTGLVKINGTAASQPLLVRNVTGQDGTGSVVGELYLQYGANKAIMLGNTGAHSISADGSLYTGNAASATKWTTARTLTIGHKGQSVNGTADVTWGLHDILLASTQIGPSTSWLISDPGVYYVASTSAFTGDGNPESANGGLTPYRYGQLIVSRATTGGVAQFYISHIDSSDSTRGIKYRTGWNSTYQTTWSSILDSSNYTNYVNITNFPGLNKVGTVTSITVTGSNGLSGSGTVTTSGTITLSNAGVRSTTINGNYLRVNTNGTNADLTIPYSTNAGSANTLNKQQLPGTTTNAADTVWCKFATLTFNDGAYSPVSGYLFFSARESTDFIGILHYHFRANSDKTVLGGASLRWLVNTNLSIQVISVKTANNVYDLYVNNYNTWSTPVIHNMLTEGSFVWNVGYWTSKPTAAHTSTQSGIVNYANSAATAGLASNVTVSNSDENKTLKLVFHDGNALKSTGGIYCNPSTDTLYSTKVIATNFTSNVATGTQPYACTSTTVNTNLNADMLDGFHLNSSTRNNEANKVVRTDGSGYTNFGWINTTSGNFTGTPDRIYASDDGYIRYMTPDNFRANVIGNNYWKVNDQTTAGTGDIYLEMWRGVNASWKILNAGGVLKFLNNYTSSAGSYFDCLTVDYNTGNTWIKGNLTNVSTTQSNRFYLRNNGTTGIYADLQINTRGTKCTTAGTAGTTGVTYLFLGNSTAVSTTIDLGAENSLGILRIYGSNTGYTDIRCGTNNTGTYTMYLPGATGLFVYHTNDTAIGSSTKPVYIASTGAATECSTYAGGTAVTLNGTSKAATTASFYAPTSAGTNNYVLKSNGSGAPTWISQSDLSVGNATNWSRCITWESPTTVNTWSKVLKIKKHSNVLLTINFSQSSQASQHLYLISTGYDCARIVLLGANKYSAHFDIQVRVTQASSTEHHVEVYNTYGYNNATTVNFDCRALNMGTSTELEGYTTYTAGSGTVKDSLISHHTISRNLAIDRLECIEILSTSTYNTVAKVKTRLEDIWNTVGRSVGSYVVVSSTAIDNWSTNTATVSSSSSYAMIKIGGAYEGNDYGLWLLSTYGDNKIGYVGRSGDTWTNIKWLATTDYVQEELKKGSADHVILIWVGYIYRERISGQISTNWYASKLGGPATFTLSTNNTVLNTSNKSGGKLGGYCSGYTILGGMCNTRYIAGTTTSTNASAGDANYMVTRDSGMGDYMVFVDTNKTNIYIRQWRQADTNNGTSLNDSLGKTSYDASEGYFPTMSFMLYIFGYKN